MIAHLCGNLARFYEMFGLDILHKILNYAVVKIQTQQTLKFDAAVCFLITVYWNERNNFAKTCLRDALHQINFIFLFFGLKNVKTTVMWKN